MSVTAMLGLGFFFAATPQGVEPADAGSVEAECTVLQTAAATGDLPTLRKLAGRRMLGLSQPQTDLDARPSKGAGRCAQRTALMLAAEAGHGAAVELLVASGAAIRQTAQVPELGDRVVDARCLALSQSHEDLAQLLQRAGAEDLPCSGNARLFAALWAHREDLLEQQLRGHPSAPTLLRALLQCPSRCGAGIIGKLTAAALGLDSAVDLSAVYAAAVEAGDLPMVEQLHLSGARLSGGDALARAVSLSRTAMFLPLLQAGARADLATPQQAIRRAFEAHEVKVLTALLEAGWKGDDDAPMVLWAMEFTPALVPQMLESGLAVEVDDEEGTTPLMFAASRSGLEWARLLLDRGASLHTANLKCQTAGNLVFTEAGQNRALHALVPATTPVPGRAARGLKLTCGSATLLLHFEPGLEVYIDGAQRTLEPLTEYRFNPGTHVLRMAPSSERGLKALSFELTPGRTEFQLSGSRLARISTVPPPAPARPGRKHRH